METILTTFSKERLSSIDKFYKDSLIRNPRYYHENFIYLFDDLQKPYHHLFDKIDRELKLNEQMMK